MNIKAAVTHEKGAKLVIEDVQIAEPDKNELLVKVAACGICHTDEAARAGHRTPFPSVLGHEGAGVVEKIGPGVSDFKVGDHVVMSYTSCGECKNCKNNQPYNCYRFVELNFFGKNINGKTPLTQNGEPLAYFFGQSTFATHAIANVKDVVKVDEDLDLRMLAPIGCGIQTGAGAVMNVLKPEKGSSIVIFGAGSVGLSAVMAAKVLECDPIIIVDIVPQRLEAAREFGATHIINSLEVKDVVAKIKEITNNEGVDFAFDNTGLDFCLKNALASMHTGGVGTGVAPTGKVVMESWVNLFIGKTWHSIIEGEAVPKTFLPYLIELYKAGKFPFDKLITYFDFEQINEAFEANHNGSAVKPVLVMPD